MLISILVFLLVLSVLILVHEFGHFIMARRAGILVEEFGFGLPPRLIGKKVGETIYSINWLPFGGFVRLHGENYEEGITNPKRAFLNKNKKTRVGIIVAGVVMNFLLGILAFAIVYSFSGIPKDTKTLKVVDVSAGSPAQSAGVVVGDVITKVGKDSVISVNDFIGKVGEQKGKSVNFEILRNGGTVKLQMKPRENPPAGEGPLGVTITTTEIYYPPVWQRPFYGVYYGFKEALFWGKNIAMGLGSIIVDAFHGHAPKDVSGPVGIFAVTSQAAKNGILTIINFVGILSINLAILNIIPFPALDGGRLLFIGIESIIGKKVIPKVEATIHSIGMIILLALILAITIGDIRRLIVNGGIDGFLKSVTK
jgi:regulator of sigma E protease